MSIFIYQESPLNATTSGNSWNSSPLKLRGLCRQVIVKATNTNTFFDFTIFDEDNIEVLHRDSNEADLNELLTLPLQGLYTLRISNSTNDEAYTVKLIIQEI